MLVQELRDETLGPGGCSKVEGVRAHPLAGSRIILVPAIRHFFGIAFLQDGDITGPVNTPSAPRMLYYGASRYCFLEKSRIMMGFPDSFGLLPVPE